MKKHKTLFSKWIGSLQAYFEPPPRKTRGTASSSFAQKPEKLDRGSALIMAVIFMVVAAFLIVGGTQLVFSSSRQAQQKNLYVAEAENVARAGVQDALSWFIRNQASGGVVAGNTVNSLAPGATPTLLPGYTSADDAFNPQSNTANAQLSDTAEVSIGIVRDYPLDDPVTANATYWGRYEVWKQDAPATTTGFYNPLAVHDITQERDTAHLNGDGYVWSIVSKGYVYKRLDKTINATTGLWNIAYNQSPNVLVATAVVGTEFRKLSLVLPQPTPAVNNQAAIYCQQISSQVDLQSTETQLNGAVSSFGNYAAIGMTSP